MPELIEIRTDAV